MTAVPSEKQHEEQTQLVFRGGARASSVLYVGAVALVSLGWAVFGFVRGYAPFGRHAPGITAVLGIGCVLYAFDVWRRGLFVEPGGVKIVRPWRLRALRISWHEIARFEMQTAPGRRPVSLIRASDQRRIPVPTFPKPRKDISEYATLPAKVQGQVDELNRLLEQHSSRVGAG